MKATKIINISAIIFGLVLSVASVVQLVNYSKTAAEVSEIEGKLEEMQLVKADLVRYDEEFNRIFSDLMALDYGVNQSVYQGIMDQDTAFVLLNEQAQKFFALQDAFRRQFFEYNNANGLPDGISTPWFKIREQYSWVVNKTTPVTDFIWIYNSTTDEYYANETVSHQAIIDFSYIEPIGTAEYRRYYAIEAFESVGLKQTNFAYNLTAEIVFNQTWLEPINVNFDNFLYEEIYQNLVLLSYGYSQQLNRMEMMLILSSVSLLLIGFLIDIEEQKFFKICYFIIAVLLTLFSLAGQTLFLNIVTGGIINGP